MKYLITKTLLDSWNYTFNCPDDFAEDAMKSFMATLRREPSEQTREMANGVEFENEVYSQAAGAKRSPHPKWERGIQRVASFIEGAPVQIRLSRDAEVDGKMFLIYGILDALNAGVIYDVKFLNKSLGSIDAYGKYRDSSQHSAYMYLVPEAHQFKYLLSDGDELYIETYCREDCRPIGDIIHYFIEWLNFTGLFPVYEEHWQTK